MKKLHKLRTNDLTNNEVGQFIKRNLSDFIKADVDFEADNFIKINISKIKDDSSLFGKAQRQIQKNENTEKLEQLDRARDNAFSIVNRLVNVFDLSDDPDELAAYRALQPVLLHHRGLPYLNYEAETLSINVLVEQLKSEKYIHHANTLNLGRYITRLQMANEAFNDLFTERSVTTAATTNYDTKCIRRTMLKNYRTFVSYIVSIAETDETPYYNEILDIVNTNRKYYSDLLAKRKGKSNHASVEEN